MRWLITLRLLIIILMVSSLAAQCTPTPEHPPLPEPPTAPPLEIALLAPITGELATFGRLLRNGMLMAIDERNLAGGLGGQQIRGRNYDTACSFESGRQVAQQAMADGMQFLLGPLCTEAALGAATAITAGEALLLTPTATHPRVTVDAHGMVRPTVFSMAADLTTQGAAAARFAYETQQLRRAAILHHPTDEYALHIAAAFSKSFSMLGGTVVQQSTAAPFSLTVTELLTPLLEAEAEVIYMPGEAALANQVAAQLQQSSEKRPLLLGGNRWHQADLTPKTEFRWYYTTHFSLLTPPPRLQQWREQYKAAYAIEPDTLAALGYEATATMLTALAQASERTPRAVAAQLEAGQFRGLAGEISFQPQHGPYRPLPIIQLTAEQPRLIERIYPPIGKTP